jgi:putative ABC transport system permease protein
LSGFLVPLRLGLIELRSRPRLAAAMALLIAIAVGIFTTLAAYRSGLTNEFGRLAPNLLVVQETQSFGEFYGSRLSPTVGQQLKDMGLSLVIPEIHAITGTSAQNANMLRGIDLQQYAHVDDFTLKSGRKLEPGDPARSAMVGVKLAEGRNLHVGGTVSLRGRDFNIIGIFQTGAYMDNEAWIALADAQGLLGWGEDVSVYIIPDEGILHEGDLPLQGLSVARKGEGARFEADQFKPVMDLIGMVTLALGIAAALALTNILWRSAWSRRREIAILRTNGFPAASLAVYLLIQAVGVTLPGFLLGGGLTWFLTVGVKVAVTNFTITPQLNPSTILTGLGWCLLLMLAGSFIPAVWLNRLNLAQLLRSE